MKLWLFCGFQDLQLGHVLRRGVHRREASQAWTDRDVRLSDAGVHFSGEEIVPNSAWVMTGEQEYGRDLVSQSAPSRPGPGSRVTLAPASP